MFSPTTQDSSSYDSPPRQRCRLSINGGEISSTNTHSKKNLFRLLWKRHLGENLLNVLAVGRVLENTLDQRVLVGTNDGRVLVLDEEKTYAVLETKGGPVQTLAVHDVTGFGRENLIVGDALGEVTTFDQQQILWRWDIGAGVRCLEVDVNVVGGFEIVVADVNGTLSAFQPQGRQWRTKTTDQNVSNHAQNNSSNANSKTRCMLSARLPDVNGTCTMNYLLICDGNPAVQLTRQGKCMHSVPVPSLVNCMCIGYFRASKGNTPSAQVALGGDNGYIYLMENYKITALVKVDHPITQLATFRPKGRTVDTDFLLCAGHFGGLRIYKDGELVQCLETVDWVHCLAVTESTGDAEKHDQIIVGSLDNTLQAYRLQVSRPRDEAN